RSSREFSSFIVFTSVTFKCSSHLQIVKWENWKKGAQTRRQVAAGHRMRLTSERIAQEGAIARVVRLASGSQFWGRHLHGFPMKFTSKPVHAVSNRLSTQDPPLQFQFPWYIRQDDSQQDWKQTRRRRQKHNDANNHEN